jgi:hypothetical protein
VTISGGGYSPGETVNIAYKTGLAAPNPRKVALFTTTAATYGTFTCDASIPDATSTGARGPHTIKAKGTTSGGKAASICTLT